MQSNMSRRSMIGSAAALAGGAVALPPTLAARPCNHDQRLADLLSDLKAAAIKQVEADAVNEFLGNRAYECKMRIYDDLMAIRAQTPAGLLMKLEAGDLVHLTDEADFLDSLRDDIRHLAVGARS